ncbi:hypothetical protein [Microbacterium sp. cx-59]|uniref:hypothetical protein n=1 Tax=Microbacterium sp. cx-59 TaxID=2891207 RepID=UPI001E4CCEC3|nr:hypothetical protein [Microbacterium sp. cx-59]MCC4906937.1 hypothetical protein [Microbacterium sp. cx-59]
MSELIEVKTIGEVERTVHASGLWDGTGPVEFSNDGETWTQAWAPSDDHAHPEFARVSVYRKDVRMPTVVTIRWDEQYPAASEEWAGKWDRSPMRHFGRTARMVAFRQTFRDLLGDTVIEDEERASAPTAPAVEPYAAPARGWSAEIEAAATVEAIDKLDGEARQARVFTPDAAGTALHRRLRTKRRQLVEAAWDPRETVTPVEPERPRPQDRLPAAGNRAARRSAARKKGRRR